MRPVRFAVTYTIAVLIENEPENDINKNADQLHDQIRALDDQMFALLRADGRIPYKGTGDREKWDRLEDERARLFEKWVQDSAAAYGLN